MSAISQASSSLRRRPYFLLSAAVVVVAAVAWGVNSQMSLQDVRAKNAAVSLAGRRAVVVGGTSGIGHGIAVRLAKANASVTIVGRDASRGAAIVDEMKATGGSGSHRFVPCDAFLLDNVRKTAETIRADTPALDILVLSQGIGTMQGRTETSEGIDQKLALHYYGRMGFVGSLLPSLRAQAAAEPAFAPRVLTILTAGVHPPYAHYRSDPEVKTHYSLKNAADAGCMYNDLAVDSLSRDPSNKGIAFIHSAPGMVDTNIIRGLPTVVQWIAGLLRPLSRSIHDSAEYLLGPVLGGGVKGGFLLKGSEGQDVPVTALHEEAREFVWAHTKGVLGRHGIGI
jgi:NAD(P)-dependent dehydrogenase (short-subunit alcohol dehydrogenase family)